jgi:hypothetical protein
MLRSSGQRLVFSVPRWVPVALSVPQSWRVGGGRNLNMSTGVVKFAVTPMQIS